MTPTVPGDPEPTPSEREGPGRRHTWWVLVSCLVLLAAWSGSGLGGRPLLLTMLSATSMLAAGVAWLVLLIRARGERGRGLRRFAIAPLVVVCTAALLHAHLPTLARFRLTQGAFDQSVHEGGAFAGGWLGSYRIDEVRQIGDGIFYFDHDGSAFDYAGFAYLPTGPSASMGSGGFESPQFQHLYGHWYTFWASW